MLHVAQTLCLLLFGVYDLELVKANKQLPFHDVLAIFTEHKAIQVLLHCNY